MRNIRFYFFALAMVLYLAYPALMIYQQERILVRGSAYQLRLEPVDPYDAFRGRYLALSFNPPPLEAPAGVEAYGQPIYVTMGVDSQGYARFERVLTERPREGDYLKTITSHVDSGKVHFEIPDNLRYYYLNEKTAPLAEAAYQELVNQPATDSVQTIRAYARIRVARGRVLIEELYFDGKPIQVYLQEK